MRVSTVKDLNNQGKNLSPEQIIEMVSGLSVNPILTTKFGPQSIYLIDIVVKILPDIQVVWIDTGFNTAQTIEFAHSVIDEYKLNINIFRPDFDIQRKYSKDAIHRMAEDERLQFIEDIKIEPFKRALQQISPDFWFTGIREEQTAYRKTLDVFSSYSKNIVRVAPLYKLGSNEVLRDMARRRLRSEVHYLDITKRNGHSECGIHFPISCFEKQL
ncbi:phosphoadenosine phosphosulfate reductase domain-containing protein [Bowmanella dokdonensis]|uniref:Phosphoadenosine phosphosulfate reductase family protein n=1 Tax=Bowmanella dokdonensis TaxID=751969 RepID=A0A939IP37_9ALTE|nr:phosphoadenosine phosphosulfate reductase family protein [Bowmanella dokdonensis]MBN7827023.1 phosphoadenosine phosphosulfate reductase family protein [Bowmanella dokdonensis]